MCEKTDEGEAESIILILVLVLSSFLSVKYFLKIWGNPFPLLTFECFKPSLPSFSTVEGKRWIDLSFSLSARFEQINTEGKLGIFKFFFTLSLSFTVYLLARFLLDRCFQLLSIMAQDTFTWERRDMWRVGTENNIFDNFNNICYCFLLSGAAIESHPGKWLNKK